MRQARIALALLTVFGWMFAPRLASADRDERWDGLVAACTQAAQTRDALAACIGVAARPCQQDDVSTMGAVLCMSNEADQWEILLGGALQSAEQREPWRIARLREAQKAWLAWREAECAYYEDLEQGGSGAQVDLVRCLRDLTATRAVDFIDAARRAP